MTYKRLISACVRVGGQVLREIDDTVSLPFGSEYSLLIKNHDSKRIQVNVSINGNNVAEGLIIGPNSSLDLERSIANNNMLAGNKFKFVERSAAVEAHRGIGSDDGLVRVEAWTERIQPTVDIPVPHYVPYDVPYRVPTWPKPPRHPRPWDITFEKALRSQSTRGMSTGGAAASSSTSTANYASLNLAHITETSCSAQLDFNDAGITVPGSESNQSFQYVSGFPLEAQSTVLVLKLRGIVGNQVVQQPITVQHKPKCVTCGKVNKATAKFCGQCGTALVIL